MSDGEERSLGEIAVDRDNLYREEIFTDLKVATIRRLIPIRADGTDDPDRDAIYVGQTTLMSQAGPIPVQCEIEARSLQEAIGKFPESVNRSIRRLLDEAREIQRQEASRIVVPGRDVGGKITLG